MNFESDYFKIVEQEGAETLAIIFATVSVPKGRFSFYKNMEQQNVHRLYVNDANNGWYQTGIPGLGSSVEETVEAIVNLKERIDAKNIVTIGSSMGGYGAILYATFLNCNALVFGAETILLTPGSRSRNFMPKNSPVLYKDLKPLVEQSTCHITFWAGEADMVDLLSAMHFQGLKNVEIISVKGIAHGVPAFLDTKYKITNIFSDFLLNKKMPEIKERGNICGEGNLVELIQLGNNQIAEKQWEKAAVTFIEGLKLSPSSDIIHHKLGIINYNLGETGEAIYHQKLSLEISPHFSNAHHQLGIALRKNGNFKDSYNAHKNAYILDPNFASAYHHAGLSLEKLCLFDEAETEFKKAFNLAKNMKNYRDKYIEVLRNNAKRRIDELTELVNSM